MSSLIGGGGAGATWRRTVGVDLERVADVASDAVPKHIRERLSRNLDVNGASLAPLDADTLKHRAASGRTSAQVLEGAPFEVREVRREVSQDRVEVTFGAANADLRRIGGYHQRGDGHLPERRWAGVSGEGLRDVVRRMLREGVMREET